MNVFVLQIILSAFCAIAIAKPAYLSYHVPLGSDGNILDTPEVARAKAAHLATQAYEAARNTFGYRYVPAAALAVYAPAITYGAPISADGQVVDTPEVAQAKAAHLAAHAQVRQALVQRQLHKRHSFRS